jgi:hypothetical protein
MINVQFNIRLISLIKLTKVTTLIGMMEFYIIKVNTLFSLYLVDINYL